MIVFLLEERSMKEVLDIILPRLLPEGTDFITIPHNGKSDLEQSIPRKLKAWRQPNTKFVIVRDQDSADCIKVKKHLKDIVEPYGREVLIRIACKELEAWYFGDLNAVSKAYGYSLESLANKRQYRDPDKIENPKAELKRLLPLHQQLEGARNIAIHMDICNNTSSSFNQFVLGVRKFVCGRPYHE